MKRRATLAASTLLATLLLTACGGEAEKKPAAAAPETKEPSRFQPAFVACSNQSFGNPLSEPEEWTLAAEVMAVDDASLIVEGGDKYLSAGAALCVLDELDAPASVVSKVNSTNSTMGRQTDSWDGIEASWSYHPDSGMNLVLELAD